MATEPPIDLEACLARFSLASFRPGQREVISAVLAGNDCLCIMPTGGGKSLCYQLPAVARHGLALVVSPLIALMKDQVDSLVRSGMRATFINSSLSGSEQGDRMRRVAAGEFDLVYVAPERFRDGRFLESLAATRVQLLAVDEAHCISEWGHDFRPDYARLGQFRRKLGDPQTIALTATATARVRQDVIDQLQLKAPATFITGFARPNLEFSALSPNGEAEKDERLVSFIAANPGSGIVYSATRKRCETLAEMLAGSLNCSTAAYHAGMLPEERRSVQERFMSGETRLIVATNAFGMGIDKSNLRFVVHYNIPGSLEAYYQEAGRAGRDGERARCLLLFSGQDRYLQEFFIENAFPSRETIEAVYEFLRQLPQDPIELTQQEIKESLGLKVGSEAIGACEQILERHGALERLDSRQNLASVRIEGDLASLVDRVPKNAKNRRRLAQSLAQVVGEASAERVYFPLARLFAIADLEPESAQRALRELARLPGLDYIPPFRGRALHVTQRSRPFRAIEIDFRLLDQRRAAEFDKLDRMVRYATMNRCRQLEFLAYFGDPNAATCGICDNCRRVLPATGSPAATVSTERASLKPSPETGDSGSPPLRTAKPPAAVQETVRKALAGVARAKGKFGKLMIAQMLCGSKSTKLARGGLNRLSTFGILEHLTQDEVAELLDALLAVRLVAQVEEVRFRPVVTLTDEGDAVMRGARELEQPLPINPRLLAKLPAPGGTRNVHAAAPLSPPHTAALPPTPPAMPPEAEASALPHIPDHLAGELDATNDEADIDHDERPVSDAYWTWRLLAAGFSVAECCAIRKLSPAIVLAHALVAGDEGREIRASWFLSPEQIERVHRVLAESGPGTLAQRLHQLQGGLEPAHVRLVLHERAQQNAAR